MKEMRRDQQRKKRRGKKGSLFTDVIAGKQVVYHGRNGRQKEARKLARLSKSIQNGSRFLMVLDSN